MRSEIQKNPMIFDFFVSRHSLDGFFLWSTTLFLNYSYICCFSIGLRAVLSFRGRLKYLLVGQIRYIVPNLSTFNM